MYNFLFFILRMASYRNTRVPELNLKKRVKAFREGSLNQEDLSPERGRGGERKTRRGLRPERERSNPIGRV